MLVGQKSDNYKIKSFDIMLPKMSGFVKSLGKTKYVFFMSFKDGGFLQKNVKSEIKSATVLKKDLRANQFIMKNFYKLK